MKFPRPFRIGCVLSRIVVSGGFLAMWIDAGASAVSAQEVTTRDVVALDRSSADLLRSCFPSMEFPVLVQVDNESFESLNARAWLLRDSGFLVFRTDRLSMTSRLLRERLMAQGVRTVDLSAYVSAGRAFLIRHEIADPDSQRPRRRESLATEFVFDQIREADPILGEIRQ